MLSPFPVNKNPPTSGRMVRWQPLLFALLVAFAYAADGTTKSEASSTTVATSESTTESTKTTTASAIKETVKEEVCCFALSKKNHEKKRNQKTKHRVSVCTWFLCSLLFQKPVLGDRNVFG